MYIGKFESDNRNALSREKWFENPKVLPGIEPKNSWIQGCNAGQYAKKEPLCTALE